MPGRERYWGVAIRPTADAAHVCRPVAAGEQGPARRASAGAPTCGVSADDPCGAFRSVDCCARLAEHGLGGGASLRP
eukprot:2196139-Pleurochrysis_carterae.AAC.1